MGRETVFPQDGSVVKATMTEAQKRKATPVFSGVLKYFPRALREIAKLSKAGNDQHNPGQPLHWAKEKSTDHEDCITRHLLDEAQDPGGRTSEGQRHLTAVAWRALAALEIALEKEEQAWGPQPSEPACCGNSNNAVKRCDGCPEPYVGTVPGRCTCAPDGVCSECARQGVRLVRRNGLAC